MPHKLENFLVDDDALFLKSWKMEFLEHADFKPMKTESELKCIWKECNQRAKASMTIRACWPYPLTFEMEFLHHLPI